jgi:branched-chain amino acid transport system ATP-binding protein
MGVTASVAARPAAPPASVPDAILAVEGLTVRFGGITALDDVSLQVRPNEILGVIGPNGAGKTTLFNAVCGFVPAQAGDVWWRGAPVGRLAPHRLTTFGISRTLQGVGLFPELTVLENVMVGAHRFERAGLLAALLALPRSDRDEWMLRDRAMTCLEDLGCGDVANRKPSELPYAVSKRVALARALVSRPDLLLLDEPAGGLGEEDIHSLASLMRRLSASCSVMLVEHHMDLVMSVCDRITVLDFGRVIASGEPAAIRENPKVLDAYLGREAELQPSLGRTGHVAA